MKYSKHKNRNESTGFLFWQVSTLWQRKIKEILKPFNLTHTQFVILAVIEELQEHAENITQKMISDISNIDVMTISSTIRLLEKKELITKKSNKIDTRANSIINTNLGSEILLCATEKVEEVDSIFFSPSTQEFHNQLNILTENNTQKEEN